MNYPLRWSGHPHHSPRIRTASTSSSAPHYCPEQLAAEQALRRPLSPRLLQLRRARNIYISPRRSSIRSTTTSAYQRKSARAKHNLQAFGWKSSTIADTIQLPHLRRPSAISLTAFQASHTPKQRVAPHNTTILSFDGAAHSTTRKKRHAKSEAQKDKPARVMEEQTVPLHTTTNRHPRTIEIDTSINGERRHQVRRGEAGIGRGTAYDTRLFSKGVKKPAGKNPSARASMSSSIETVARREPYQKQVFRKDFRKSSSQGKGVHHDVNPLVRKATPKKLSIAIRRSPSERAALKRFTLELERHLQATRELPPQSPPSKGISTHTIEDLLPYKAQLNAAGLAVTSKEQRGQGLQPFKPIQLPEQDPTKRSAKHSNNIPGTFQTYGKSAVPHERHSTSTGTIVLGFTPPHKQSSSQVQGRRPSISSDHTIIDFTPPHELQAESQFREPVKSTRTSLPWLRNHKQIITQTCGAGTDALSRPPLNLRDSDNDLTVNTNMLTQRLPSRSPLSYDEDSESQLHRLPESACVPHATKVRIKGKASHHTTSIASFQSDQAEDIDPVQQDDDGRAISQVVKSKLSDKKPVDPVIPRKSQNSAALLRTESSTSIVEFRFPHYPRLPIHTCVDRDSLVCQQCCPSPRSSGGFSPRQTRSRQLSTSDGIPSPINEARYRSTFSSIRRSVPKRTNVRMPSSASRIGISGRTVRKTTENTGRTTGLSRPQGVSDKTVFKGLHVATAAACDDDIDVWIEEITGLSVRGFLASLSQFSGLGVSALADVARRAAQHRQGEVEAWETVHRDRVIHANAVPTKGARPS